MVTIILKNHCKIGVVPAALVLLVSLNACQGEKQTAYPWPQGIEYPVAEKKGHLRSVHGDTVADPYYWMIDYFKEGPESDKVIDYLDAENEYLETMMAGTRQFQEGLFDEMKSRIEEKDETVPTYKNGYFYYTHTEEGGQYYKYCRKKGSLDAPEEIIADVDAMAEGHAYYQISEFSISP